MYNLTGCSIINLAIARDNTLFIAKIEASKSRGESAGYFFTMLVLYCLLDVSCYRYLHDGDRTIEIYYIL